MTSWVAGNGTSHHPIEPQGNPANINRVAFKGKRHLNQRNMKMFNKDMIRIDDLFAPVSFGGGGGGGGSYKPPTKSKPPAPTVVSASEKQDYCGSSTNGTEWVPDKIGFADISGACKKHDKAHEDGVNKTQADIQLGKDVTKQCLDGHGAAKNTVAVKTMCVAAGAFYAGATLVGAQDAYDKAQTQ